jgi:hypothetical protein
MVSLAPDVIRATTLAMGAVRTAVPLLFRAAARPDIASEAVGRAARFPLNRHGKYSAKERLYHRPPPRRVVQALSTPEPGNPLQHWPDVPERSLMAKSCFFSPETSGTTKA